MFFLFKIKSALSVYKFILKHCKLKDFFYSILLLKKIIYSSNLNKELNTGFISAGAFINYFCDNNIPWMHIDVASCTFVDEKITSYGINLLYEFIKNINSFL